MERENFQDLIDSYFNGQFTQLKQQFYKLRNDNKLAFITFISNVNNSHGLSESDIVVILGFLLRKKCEVLNGYLTNLINNKFLR